MKILLDEVKLKNIDGGEMIVDIDNAERILTKSNRWSPIAVRTKIRKDSEAARVSQHQGVTIGTGNVFHRPLRLKKGTNYKAAMKAIRKYREDMQIFSWLVYHADWR